MAAAKNSWASHQRNAGEGRDVNVGLRVYGHEGDTRGGNAVIAILECWVLFRCKTAA